KNEVACGLANVTGDHGCFLSEPITLESDGDDAVVVWPDGSVLVGKWIVRWIIGRERAYTPTAPHVGFQKPFHHASGTFAAYNPAPQQVPGIGCDRLYLLLVAVESVCIETGFFTPEELFEFPP